MLSVIVLQTLQDKMVKETQNRIFKKQTCLPQASQMSRCDILHTKACCRLSYTYYRADDNSNYRNITAQSTLTASHPNKARDVLKYKSNAF